MESRTPSKRILDRVLMVSGISILKGASALIAMHHECYDGSAFPKA